MRFFKGFVLLLIPALIPSTGLLFIEISENKTIEDIELMLIFMIIAAISNIIPFVILLFIHFKMIKDKAGFKDYGFYSAYWSAILAMSVLSLLIIREQSSGKQGSALVVTAFFFMANITIPVMIVAYLVGWVVEARLRKERTKIEIKSQK